MQTSGIDSAVGAAKGADAAVVVVGSMPFINGRENDDRTFMNLAPGQEALVKAVTRPTRTPSWCWRTVTRRRLTGNRPTARRSSGPATRARRPATRSRTCCSATTTRQGT